MTNKIKFKKKWLSKNKELKSQNTITKTNLILIFQNYQFSHCICSCTKVFILLPWSPKNRRGKLKQLTKPTEESISFICSSRIVIMVHHLNLQTISSLTKYLFHLKSCISLNFKINKMVNNLGLPTYVHFYMLRLIKL